MSATPRREFVERAKALLTMNETNDFEPPYRCLPQPGSESVWMKIKVERLAKALQQTAEEARKEAIEECAQAAERTSPRHTECQNKIAYVIRKLGESNE